jgi:hypothetical protein
MESSLQRLELIVMSRTNRFEICLKSLRFLAVALAFISLGFASYGQSVTDDFVSIEGLDPGRTTAE